MQTIQSALSDKKLPFISFIIAYYDLPVEWLRECIDSILALPLQNEEREIIIVDDGSARSVESELADYGTQIRYVRQKNGGLSSARNTGIETATGEYIQFVDGDDKLNPTPYSRCLDLIKSKESDMVLFDFSHKNTRSKTCNMIKYASGAAYMATNNIHASAWGYIARRATIGDLRFTKGIYHEDEEFTPLLLLRASSVCHTDTKAYMYRKRSGSITTSRTDESVTKRLNDKKGVILRLNKIAQTLSGISGIAMERRVAQLTMDYIYNVIIDTRAFNLLAERLNELSDKGLFPLPDRRYTPKYTWFRRLTNSRLGLRLLLFCLPLSKKER